MFRTHTNGELTLKNLNEKLHFLVGYKPSETKVLWFDRFMRLLRNYTIGFRCRKNFGRNSRKC